MAVGEREILSLLDTLYDTCSGGDWGPFLARLRTHSGAASVVLLQHQPNPFSAEVVGQSGCDEGALREYGERWAQDNELIAAGQRRGLLRPGVVSCSLEALSGRAWENSAVYDGWYRPQGYYCMWGVTVYAEGGRLATVSLQYPREELTWNNDARRLLEATRQHLTRALHLRGRLSKAERGMDALIEAVNRMSCGVCLLDKHARLVVMSGAAERILHQADGLALDADGALQAAAPGEQVRLAKLIGGCLRAETTAVGGGALAVTRPSGRAAYQVLVTPSRPGGQSSPDEGLVVFLSDPEQVMAPSHQSLRAMYGLTPAEARVAAQIAIGLPVTMVAERLGVSRETVRSQLKSVYAKTDVHGQAALLQRLHTNVTGLRWGGR